MSTTPEDRIPRSSSLCSLGPRPYIMTQLLILALREHFSCAANIEHEVFRARLWTSDETTKIQVEDETVWKPEQAGKRPAIVVKRNEWKCTKLGIGDVSGTTAQGFRELIAMWHGSHTLFCIAKMGIEAEMLSCEVARHLLHFQQVYRQDWELEKLQLEGAGALHELEEATERYVIPVTVSYDATENWVLREHTPVLKKVAISDLFPPKIYALP